MEEMKGVTARQIAPGRGEARYSLGNGRYKMDEPETERTGLTNDEGDKGGESVDDNVGGQWKTDGRGKAGWLMEKGWRI